MWTVNLVTLNGHRYEISDHFMRMMAQKAARKAVRGKFVEVRDGDIYTVVPVTAVRSVFIRNGKVGA